jgi:hypothetical protein
MENARPQQQAQIPFQAAGGIAEQRDMDPRQARRIEPQPRRRPAARALATASSALVCATAPVARNCAA